MSTTKITSTQPAPTDFFEKPQGKGFTIDFEQQVSPSLLRGGFKHPRHHHQPADLGSGKTFAGRVY